jgi:hypothetical protein
MLHPFKAKLGPILFLNAITAENRPSARASVSYRGLSAVDTKIDVTDVCVYILSNQNGLCVVREIQRDATGGRCGLERAKGVQDNQYQSINQ